MIRLENVTKYYPENETPALDGLSLHIRKGEFVFVLGSSGAGKSTFIKLLLREVTADSGSVLVNGFNLKKIRRRKVPHLRRSMGVVFQDFRLIPTMTAYENVAFAMRVTNVPEREIRERVPFVLKLVGLGDKLDRYPEQLSGGEQQRVALARALVHSPQLIIADEPTGNIDPALSVEIMELLSAINSVGVTVVVATHEHDLVNRFRKRIIRIEQGKVVSDTNPPQEGDSMPHATEDGEAALNRLAEEQRRQTGAAWGTDANLHVSLEHLQVQQPVQPVQESVPFEEPEEEPWEDAADEPFVTSVRKKSNTPSWEREPQPAEESPEEIPEETAVQAPSAQDAFFAQTEVSAVSEQVAEQPAEEPEVQPADEPADQPDEQPAQEEQARPRLGDPDHTTTMEDVDELLRQLLNG
jgi:cell division transport system ATP-binding protein